MILARYVARRFLRSFVTITGAFLLILLLIDMIEMIRRFSDRDIGLGGALGLAALNVAASFYSILPLLTVLAGIALFLNLARTSEMVAIRASGSPLCCCRLRPKLRWRAGRRSISAARKRRIRCGCGRTGSGLARRRSCSRRQRRCAIF